MFATISKNINRFSVKTQVISITVLSLVGITSIVVGANYISTLVSDATDFNIVTTDKARLLGALDKFGLEMLRHEKQYLASPTDQSIQGFGSAFLNADGVYRELLSEMKIESNIKALSLVFGNFENYKSQFANSVEMRQELGLDVSLGLIGELNKSITDTDKTLELMKKDLYDPGQLDPINVDLFTLRLYQKDFILSGDSAYLKAFNEGLKAVDASIKDSYLNKDQRAAILGAVENYKVRLVKWSELKEKYNQQVTLLSEFYGNYSVKIKQLINTYTVASDAATEQRIATQHSSNN